MDSNKVVRVQVDLLKKRVDLIDQMLELTGTRTRRDYIDQAILLLAWAIGNKAEGKEIGAIDSENANYQGILLPILADASPTVSYGTTKTRSGGSTTPSTTQTTLRVAAAQ